MRFIANLPDNLSQNIKRGLRQKLRRGEWMMPAPYGYVNNRKTRNIEPDPVKSKIIKKAYEEFATGKYTMKSISNKLAFWGVLSKRGKPLVPSAIKRLLTNKIYIGLIVYNGETYEGSFPPLISQKLYDDVQKVWRQKAPKNKRKTKHYFPFTGLLTCAECGCSITAQYANGHGGLYSYYRCSKRREKCSQKYLRDDFFVEQIKEKLKTISLPEKWIEKMLSQINLWENEQKESSGKLTRNLNEKIEQVSHKLDKLVDAFLEGIIDKEIYLVKKNKLIHQKTSFYEKKKDFRKKGYASEFWLEPLREFVKAAHRAEKLAMSNDFEEIKSFVKKIGTNPQLLNRRILLDFEKPFDLISEYKLSTARRNATQKNSIPQKIPTEIDKNCRLKSPINTGHSEDFINPYTGKKPSDFSSENQYNQPKKSIALQDKNKNHKPKSPINTGIAENSIISQVEKIPRDFSSENRFNQQKKSIVPQKENKNYNPKSPIDTGLAGNSIISCAEEFPPDFSSKNRFNRQEKSIENSIKCGRRVRRKIVDKNSNSADFSAQNSECSVWWTGQERRAFLGCSCQSSPALDSSGDF